MSVGHQESVFQINYLRIGAIQLLWMCLDFSKLCRGQASGISSTESLKLKQQMTTAAVKKVGGSRSLLLEMNDVEVEEESSIKVSLETDWREQQKVGESGSLQHRDGSKWEDLQQLSCAKPVILTFNGHTGSPYFWDRLERECLVTVFAFQICVLKLIYPVSVWCAPSLAPVCKDTNTTTNTSHSQRSMTDGSVTSPMTSTMSPWSATQLTSELWQWPFQHLHLAKWIFEEFTGQHSGCKPQCKRFNLLFSVGPVKTRHFQLSVRRTIHDVEIVHHVHREQWAYAVIFIYSIKQTTWTTIRWK